MRIATSIYIALLLTVFLLAFPGDGYTGIQEFKHSLFLLICGGYVITIAVLRVMYVITDTEPVGKIREKLRDIPIANKFLLGFLLATIISSVFSVHPGTFFGSFRYEGVLTIGIYILSCFFVSIYFRPQIWMLFLFGGVVGLSSILALIQLTGANPFTLYPEGFNYYDANVYYSGEFLSTIGNAGLFGAFLSLAVGILAMAFIKFDFKERWFLVLPFFIAVLLIFEMGIDAALLALLVGFALMFPIAVTSQKTLANTLIVFAIITAAFGLSQALVFQDGPILFASVNTTIFITVGLISLFSIFIIKSSIFAKISTRQYRAGATVIILSSICFALITLWQYSGQPVGMIYEASQVLRGNWDDDFGTGRVFIWRSVLEAIQWSTLLLGTGPDTLGYWGIYFSRYDEHLGVTLFANTDAAHNELLHILATGGLLSLLAYLGALLFAAVNWIRYPENPISAVAGAGVLFYVIQAFFGISQSISAPFFWTCFAILLYTQKK